MGMRRAMRGDLPKCNRFASAGLAYKQPQTSTREVDLLRSVLPGHAPDAMEPRRGDRREGTLSVPTATLDAARRKRD